jgi:hypothetical protein
VNHFRSTSFRRINDDQAGEANLVAIIVFGQEPKECNEVTSLATHENAERDLIKPPRLA